MSLADLAKSSGVPRPSVWRAETDPNMVKGETLKMLLTGLGLRAGGKEWSRAVSLWTAAHVNSAGRGDELERVLGRVSQLDAKKLQALRSWLERQK